MNGGLDLAVAEAFGAEVGWHVEYDTAPSKILAHHWPDVPNYGDVTKVDWSQMPAIDILTGGYPCQPFSTAGQRKGTNDDRHLWPYVREAIRVLRPRYTVLENVAGHRSLGFDRVLGDMAEDGLDVRWTSVRASDVGAPHHRERLFIVVASADADSGRCGQGSGQSVSGSPEQSAAVGGVGTFSGDGRTDAPDVMLLPTPTVGNATGTNERRGGARGDELLLPGVAVAAATGQLLPTPRTTDANGPGHHGEGGPDLRTAITLTAWGKYEPAIRRWEQLTRPAPPPTEPNRNGRPRLNAAFAEWMMGLPAGWITAVPGISRNDQLKAIGNGVCPQQAFEALQEIV